MLGDDNNISDILGYVLKISNVRTRLFNSVVLFTVLIVMLRHSLGDNCGISA